MIWGLVLEGYLGWDISLGRWLLSDVRGSLVLVIVRF